MSLTEAMLNDLSQVSKKLSVMYDPEYGWTGMVSTKDTEIPVTNTPHSTSHSAERTIAYLWNWVEKRGGFRKIGEHI